MVRTIDLLEPGHSYFIMKLIYKNGVIVLIIGFTIFIGLGLVQKLVFPTKQNKKPTDFALAKFFPTGTNFPAVSSQSLIFPNDHGNHPESASEIWQLIGFLKTGNESGLSFDTTFFRQRLSDKKPRRKSAWTSHQVFGIKTAMMNLPTGSYRDFQTSREALDLAGYDQANRKLWVYKRQFLLPKKQEDDPLFELSIPDFPAPTELTMKSVKTPVESNLTNSFRYYTVSRMRVNGTVKLSGTKRSVSGQAFFEHSWGNLPLTTGQLVRNRLFAQLSNRTELILLQTRRKDGSGKPINNGLMILADSSTVALEQSELIIDPIRIWTSPETGIRYPIEWQVQIPDKSITINLNAWVDNRETNDFMVNWSGPTSVTGRFDAKQIQGFGYLQLSGYFPSESN